MLGESKGRVTLKYRISSKIVGTPKKVYQDTIRISIQYRFKLFGVQTLKPICGNIRQREMDWYKMVEFFINVFLCSKPGSPLFFMLKDGSGVKASSYNLIKMIKTRFLC